jgi:RED-like protein N-terminal region
MEASTIPWMNSTDRDHEERTPIRGVPRSRDPLMDQVSVETRTKWTYAKYSRFRTHLDAFYPRHGQGPRPTCRYARPRQLPLYLNRLCTLSLARRGNIHPDGCVDSKKSTDDKSGAFKPRKINKKFRDRAAERREGVNDDFAEVLPCASSLAVSCVLWMCADHRLKPYWRILNNEQRMKTGPRYVPLNTNRL